MSIYAISDLHLSFGVKDKPMNIFGDRWNNYEERLKENWNKIIGENDTVIIAGDISWAMYLDEALLDFKFIESLNGKKIILKGNHDYWWETLTKSNKFLKDNNISSIEFLHNNFYEVEKYFICGTRYWDENEQEEDNLKIMNRECERAKISLDAAKKMDENKEIVFVTHFPPDDKIIEIVKNYNVKYWIYGHIHSKYEENIVNIDGINSYLTSADYLEFVPIKIV